MVFPNPYFNEINLRFNNRNSWDEVVLEMYDAYGRLNFRRNYGKLPVGNTTLRLAAYDLKMRAGIYFVTLKLNGRIVATTKVVRNKNP